jgi:chemotaxis protein CheD
MKEYALSIGEVKIFDYPVTLVCHGLGSCVGLFMHDRVKGISGGAHIFLPENEKGPAGINLWYNVTAAVGRIVEQFQHRGSMLTAVRAKIAGGANTLNTTFCTGKQNITSVIAQLEQLNIHIAGLDVGGNACRTARFMSDSGTLLVRTSDTKYYKVY